MELTNGNLQHGLKNVRLQLNFEDESGNPANDMFAIRGPVLDTLTAVDGTGTLGPDSSGTAIYTFIPRRDAAPEKPTVYRIGGTLSYYEDLDNDGTRDDDGTEPLITVPFLPRSRFIRTLAWNWITSCNAT